ncbi:MAG TPA: MMPL family transporter [Streptosporangiaceae bacterium]|nr:MMPL family transporter [Streptosporangiaceae bacterium]
MQLSTPSAAPNPKRDTPGEVTRARRERRAVVERIASWSAGHRIIALTAWLLMVGGALLAGQVYGTTSVTTYDPGQSGTAERMLSQLNVVPPPSENVLVAPRAPGPGHAFPQYPPLRLAAREVVSALRQLPRVAADIQSPLGREGKGLIAARGGGAMITFQVAGSHHAASTTVLKALRVVSRVQARHPDLIVAEAGDASVSRAATAMLGQDFHQAERTSVPLTLLLLLIVFGALIAASIPVILAGTAVMTAVSLLAIPSRWLPISQGTSEVVLIIGMAVGIDYTLFYLRREREERAAGASFHDALRTAAATSGRAIVISGLTVMVSLAGLLFTGIDMFTGFAIGTITVVGVAVAGSLTALPALLSLLGPWADRGRIPFLGKARTRGDRSRLWGALVRRVVARPLVWGGLAVVVLGGLAVPALGMRLGNPSLNLPPNLPVVRTMALIQRDFPGGPAPAQVVVEGPGVKSQAFDAALARLRSLAAEADGAVGADGADGSSGAPALVTDRRLVTAQPIGGGQGERQGEVISVPLPGSNPAAGGGGLSSGGARATQALLALRNRILPDTLGKVRGISYAVSGDTASDYDYLSTLSAAAPLVFGLVAGLAFVLLLVAFGSVTIPLVSIGLNLLSVGAAYGLITIIFQNGHLEGVLGFTSFGGIMDWVPLFMFVFLFGLSMDYHVFILSRIKELRMRGAATSDAVIGGISTGAGVVTSAAVIMVAVFSIFASLSTIDLKMIGVGLAFAVFVDATVVRGICVPAALALLGERSWYLPGWLRWLPSFTAG